MLPSRLPKDRRSASWRSASGFGECGLPSLRSATACSSRRAWSMWSGSPGRDGLPGVPGRVGCRNTERGQQPVLAVGAVVGQGLAGPLAGDQDAAAGVAEVLGVGGPCPCTGPGPGRAGRSGAGCRSGASSRTAASTAVAQRLSQPGGMRPLRRRSRPGGSRRPAWSGTWSGSRCTGPRPWTRRARPGRRTGPRTGPRAAARHRRRWRPAPRPRSGRTSPVSGSR